LVDKLGSIIVDDSSGHAKAVYYKMFDKFDHVIFLLISWGWFFSIWRSNRLWPRWTDVL